MTSGGAGGAVIRRGFYRATSSYSSFNFLRARCGDAGPDFRFERDGVTVSVETIARAARPSRSLADRARPRNANKAAVPTTPFVDRAYAGVSAVFGCSIDRRADVFALVKAYEVADWTTMGQMAARVGIPSKVIPQLYLESLDWSADVFRSASVS
jgi:hypothetical protein